MRGSSWPSACGPHSITCHSISARSSSCARSTASATKRLQTPSALLSAP
jgi:hypothetical protein